MCVTRRGVIRKRMNALDNARESRATDMLLNFETVKYFCNEKFELDRYDGATRAYQVSVCVGADRVGVCSCRTMSKWHGEGSLRGAASLQPRLCRSDVD